MLAQKAPEGGWKKWFLEHPYQRTRYPILRSHNVKAIFSGDEWPAQPSDVPQFEYVEMWYNSTDHKVYASLNGGPPDWLYFGPSAPEHQWDDGVQDLFDHCVDREPLAPPPEPSGSGWDDFDWSR
jgi:hypothetical protein